MNRNTPAFDIEEFLSKPFNQRYESKIRFDDAAIHIDTRQLVVSYWKVRQEIEKHFKRDVFSRLVQQLNRMGWKCEIPQSYIEDYSHSFARNFRLCQKGDLYGFIQLTGYILTFKMWQNINTPDREKNDGEYQSNQEKHAPYLLRLEMLRTKNRLKNYFINIFGFDFQEPRKELFNGYFGITAEEWVIEHRIKNSSHYLPELGHAQIYGNNDQSADGKKIIHGSTVYFYDIKGRLCKGKALYSLNMMWNIITGKYDYSVEANHEIFVDCPANPRLKNQKNKFSTLEKLKLKAIKNENFEKAIIFRNLINEFKAA